MVPRAGLHSTGRSAKKWRSCKGRFVRPLRARVGEATVRVLAALARARCCCPRPRRASISRRHADRRPVRRHRRLRRRRDGARRHGRGRLPQARRRPHAHLRRAVRRRGWRAPQRVDAGQRFDSSWPAIGAGNGGRLVVAWVQEFGPASDRLYSASLDPGARRFQAPVPSTSTSASRRHVPVAVDERGRQRLPRLPRPAGADQHRPARLRPRRAARRALRRLLLVGLGWPLDRNVAGAAAAAGGRATPP